MTRKVKAISPVQARDLLLKNQRAVLIDVRSSMEYLFVGHAQGSIHVAWIDEPDWVVNPEFVTEVRKVLLGGVGLEEHRSDAPVVLICRSGKRSLEAGKTLMEGGVENVFHIDEGFEGELDDEHHRRLKALGDLAELLVRGEPVIHHDD